MCLCASECSPWLVQNLVHDGKGIAGVVLEHSDAEMQAYTVCGHDRAGVVVAGGSNPGVRKNKVSGCTGEGIIVCDADSSGTFRYV